jgi:hypothetical protein
LKQSLLKLIGRAKAWVSDFWFKLFDYSLIGGGAGELTSTTAAGNLKDLFAEMTEVRPVHAVLQENVAFDKQNEPGNLYKFPALLSFQGGAIPSAFGALPTAAVMNEGPLSAEIQFGQAQGFNVTIPVVIPFDMMAASSNGKKSAYANVPQLIMYTAKMAAERDTELSNLAGQFGLGVISSLGAETGTTDSRLGAGFYRDITFTMASWADGVFAGADRHRFDLYDTTGATQRNASGALSIIKVSFNSQTVRFFYVTTNTISTAVAGDVLWRRNFKTASGFNEAQGLLSAFSATSGNVWGLSTSYSQWLANQYAVGGALTFGKIAKGLQVAVSRSNLRKPMEIYVPNQSWADLIRDLADLTRNNQPPIETLKNGAAKIEYSIQIGPIKVINHGYMPNGYTFAFPADTCRRIGATEPTMDLAGNELSVMSTTTTGYQFNIFGNQAIIQVMLGAATLFTGIVADA